MSPPFLDVKARQQTFSSDIEYNEILAQSTFPIFLDIILLDNAFSCIAVLIISHQLIFQSQDALIMKGELINQSGQDLQTLSKQKGCCLFKKPNKIILTFIIQIKYYQFTI
ncbi:unnamed protein product [Paramecium octaurelia]|uniref:Uncharacterized protein n=1 Tax=Paramecium octaurelia TaxID=43137 RepID=A0A8S1Y9E7_PAROT|nr:unnamed protein product [Paramecium octaurelia]